MFASAAYSPNTQRQAGAAYKQVHLTTGVSDASPHALVGMLFDGLFDALARARGAMRGGNVEARGKAISHAISIVGEGLRGCLNLTDGGALAANLDGLYGYVSMQLVQANLNNSEAVLDECVQLLTPVREAWSQIASQTVAAA